MLFLNFVRWYKQNKTKTFSRIKENIAAPDRLEASADKIDIDRTLVVLTTLSEEKQEIVKLRFWDNLKFHEIAVKLNKNEAAVKKMFYRTLLEIKERIE